MRNFAYLALTLFLLAGLAAAQIPTSGNIFVGYSYVNTDWSGINSGLSRPNLNGWAASLEGKLFPHIGIGADFASHYGSQSFTQTIPGGPTFRVNVTGHQWELLFGPRLSIPVGNLTPFGEVMIGLAHINHGGTFAGPTNTSFATAVGGGVDYRLIKILALRLQVDYLHTRFYSTTQNDLRLSPGLVLRF